MSEHKHVIKFDVKTYPCKCGLEFSQEFAETLVEAALSGSLPTVQLGIDLEFEKRKVAELEAEVTKCHELQDSYCDRIAELEAAQRWIPVSEPPKIDGTYLLRNIYEDVYSCDFIADTNTWVLSEYDSITHWMPLPTPPEVQE